MRKFVLWSVVAISFTVSVIRWLSGANDLFELPELVREVMRVKAIQAIDQYALVGLVISTIALLALAIEGRWLSKLGYWVGRQNKTIEPTWPLRDFVRYLATDASIAFEFDDYRVWDDEVSRKVVDAFADEGGKLVVWGRRSSTGKETGELGPPERLPHSYWLENKLDWSSCVAKKYAWTAHTWVMFSKEPRYDLKVNKEQAIRLFPRASFLVRWKQRTPASASRLPQEVIEREHHIMQVWRSLDGKATAMVMTPKAENKCPEASTSPLKKPANPAPSSSSAKSIRLKPTGTASSSS